MRFLDSLRFSSFLRFTSLVFFRACIKRRTRGQGNAIESESESFVATKARESLLWQGRAMAGSRSSDRQRKQLRNGDSCIYPPLAITISTIRIPPRSRFRNTRYHVRARRYDSFRKTREGGWLIFFISFFFFSQKIPFDQFSIIFENFEIVIDCWRR